MLSSTVQSGAGNTGPSDQNDDDDDPGPGGGGSGRYNGSYHCKSYKERGKCDVCSYMETSFVTSYYFRRKFAIHGRNVHLPAGKKKKMK